jgi:hypothetical protein
MPLTLKFFYSITEEEKHSHVTGVRGEATFIVMVVVMGMVVIGVVVLTALVVVLEVFVMVVMVMGEMVGSDGNIGGYLVEITVIS